MDKGTIFTKKIFFFWQKDADISKIKKTLVLKGIFSETTYVCILTYQISSFNFTPAPPQNGPLKSPPRLGLMSEKYIKACKYINQVEHLLLLASTVTNFVSISAFASLVAIPVSIASSAVGIKTRAITAGITRYKSIIKKKKKKHDKIALLAKSKLNRIEVLISKALIDSYISHDEFVSVNNVLREYYEMKEHTI